MRDAAKSSRRPAPSSSLIRRLRLVGLDVHGIPPRRDEPFHLHHDLTFYFQAVRDEFHAAEEVREVAWCALSDFDRYQLPGNLRRSCARALAA